MRRCVIGMTNIIFIQVTNFCVSNIVSVRIKIKRNSCPLYKENIKNALGGKIFNQDIIFTYKKHRYLFTINNSSIPVV